EHVDPRLSRADLSRQSLHLGDPGEIAAVDAMSDTGSELAELGERGLATRPVARHQHEPGARAGQPLGCNPSDPGRSAGEDDDLSVHALVLSSARAVSSMAPAPFRLNAGEALVNISCSRCVDPDTLITHRGPREKISAQTLGIERNPRLSAAAKARRC